VLALGIAVVGIAAVGACTTVPGGGAIPVAAPTSATAEHRAVSPLDEPTGSVTSSSASTRASSTAPPTVTVTSVPPTTKPKTTAKSTPKTTTTTKAKPKPTQTPTPKATATPKPTATKSTATTAPTAPKTPATGPTVSGCGNPNPGKVLLTFDDGGPKAAAILAILDRYRIKARWFPTGQWANANGAMIQRLIADGQMLGNHTYSHPQMLSSLGKAELTRQVDLGYHPTEVFRFPFGASDATSRAIVTGKGYSICGWSIDTLDWRGNSADAITRIVTSQARPGSVVLMHMAFQADVDALPRIIENLRSRGLI
jgi:peptidoglycan/xylan/chitin deacetylase (PgdA/CDA1 family)